MYGANTIRFFGAGKEGINSIGEPFF